MNTIKQTCHLMVLALEKLRGALNAQGRKSEELSALYALEQDQESWYSIAKALRDYTSHVGGVARALHVGGVDHRKVKLRHPRTGAIISDHFPNTYSEWLEQMKALILDLRKSAMGNCGVI
jgi:hypothetical protein